MKSYTATQTVPPFGQAGHQSRRAHSFQRTQKTDVYDAIVQSGSSGITRPEIAAKVGLAPDRISFYLSDLRRAGYIAVKGDPTTVSATMNATEASFAAMLGLENALICMVREMPNGATSDMDRSFLRYTKTKERALATPAPGSSLEQIKAQRAEAKVALRMAILELVKLIY